MPTQAPSIVTLDLSDPADEALFRRGHEVDVAAERLLLGDRSAPWTADEELASDRNESSSRSVRGIALVGDDTAVGTWYVGLSLRDNLDVASFDLIVHPDHRRRGVGSHLLDQVEQVARDHGRRILQTWQGHPVDAGTDDPTEAFAGRNGFVSALPSLRSDLDLEPDPDGVVKALAPLDAELAGRASPGYRLVTWWDACPEEWLDDRAHLMQRMSTDAPAGDMAIEEEDWDGARVREHEAVARAQGRHVVETAAVHLPTGRLVAFTMLAVRDRSPEHAFQWDTLVLREHRGRRLGMAVKAANLRALTAGYPAVRRVTTYNAESNTPMLRVNRAMGFRPVLRTTCWQRTLD